VLRRAGFTSETPSRHGEWEKSSAFCKAKVTRGIWTLAIDWAAGSAFRFFSMERDPMFGWRLHRFAVATNKAPALLFSWQDCVFMGELIFLSHDNVVMTDACHEHEAIPYAAVVVGPVGVAGGCWGASATT
jgi:hypothetical protein